MPGMPERGTCRVLPPEPTAIRQWCAYCQRCTPSVIIEGRTYCAVCEADGRNWDE